MGMGLSPTEGEPTLLRDRWSNPGVCEISLSPGADGHEEQNSQGSCKDPHDAGRAEGATSEAGAGVSVGLSSAPAPADLLLYPCHWVGTGFQERK